MAYGLKYTVPFKTISDVDCVVNIEVKDYSGSSIELTGGATPFTIPTDESDLLVPIRPSSATLSVFGSDYLRDLYTSDPQGVRITQLTGGNVHWMGFLTPDTFSQNFTNPEFIYEMECVCALSTLKYRKFDFTDDFVTFAQIASKAIEYAGYSDVIYTNSVRLKSGSYFSARIASANFYDELGEAMTYYEVLEEIAKYAGCTWEPYEDILYFKDSAAIRSGYVSYTRLSGGVVNLQDLKNVTGYKGTGTKISRIAGKNKAVVNCSLYEVENLLPEWNNKNTVMRYEDGYGRWIGGKKKEPYLTKIRFYSTPEYTFYQYKWVNGVKTVTETNEPITDGGVSSSDYSSTRNQTLGGCFVRSTYYNTKETPGKLSFENELMIKTKGHPNDISAGQYITSTDPVIRMESKRAIMLTDKTYLCFNGGCKRNYAKSDDGSTTGDEDYFGIADPVAHHPSPSENSIRRIKLKLQVGGYFYNGEYWTMTESTFEVEYVFEKGENMFGVYKSVKNTNVYTLGVGDLSGYIINPPPVHISGKCTLTIYAISHMELHRYVYLKGIGLEYAIQDMGAIYDDWTEKESKNDLIYENVIEGDYIEEADEIDLKICTNPDGKLAFSSVLEGNSFLEEIETDVYGTGKAEEILIQRVIDMYETPRFVIDPTLANNAKPWTKFTEPHLNKQFLVAGGEEDVKMERTRYNLIEL